MKRKLVTNISCIQYGDIRLWAHALLIGRPFQVFKEDDTRQIRGLGWGGMEIFTLWIDPAAEIKIEPSRPSGVIVVGDAGVPKDLFGGVTVSVDKPDITIYVAADDHDQPIAVEEIADGVEIFGDFVDERILKYAGGSAYPRAVWTQIPERFRRHDPILR